MKRKKIDINLIIAIGVLLASIGTLIVSTRQASIMNEQTEIQLEQSKSSAWPSLGIEMTRNIQKDGLQDYFFTISNRGTGPAIVEQTSISYEGKLVASWEELYNLMNVPDSIKRHEINILLNRVIKPNEDFMLINWAGNRPLMNHIYPNSDKISITICFKSVFGDYWQVKRDGMKNNFEENITKQTGSCEPLNGKKFLQ